MWRIYEAANIFFYFVFWFSRGSGIIQEFIRLTKAKRIIGLPKGFAYKGRLF